MIRESVPTSESMEAFGRELASELKRGDVVLLNGPLGAGKTTLSRGIGAGLGVRGPVQSPTFVIARTHPNLGDGPALVHVDAYRLSDSSYLDDLDLDFENSVVVVEWGSGLVHGMDSVLDVVIDRSTAGLAPDQLRAGIHDPEHLEDEPRIVTVSGTGPRWAETRFAITY